MSIQCLSCKRHEIVNGGLKRLGEKRLDAIIDQAMEIGVLQDEIRQLEARMTYALITGDLGELFLDTTRQ